MSGRIAVKSIIKQPARKTPTAADEQKEKVERDRKNLNIALKHAHLIQHRKDVEAAILNSITTLLDFPATSTFTTKEAIAFVSLVKAFQPSDYDSLVEERRIDSKCGYALCRNPPRSQTMGPSSAWKLRKGMNDYCSDTCAKKSLLVKAQLSEVPAWERVPEQQPDIRLHEDDEPPEIETAMRRANRAARVDAWRQKVAKDEELAMERGEKTDSMRPNQVMAETVVEKQPKPFKPSDAEAGIGHYSSIEGYQPKAIRKGRKDDSDASDGEEDDAD
ncbi:Hypothetical predicted protein [Lecanosticta acicola]|uniref:RNA polymerase II subunit B1 CTD phosphatase RPAP2 homolog n=1 Tax=Lecanosticta acicola TaxID=111012 RepID=A0AAI8Z1N7_9PEZI|nr:Hypothetical predicted protein [Lecanosticta acicola]